MHSQGFRSCGCKLLDKINDSNIYSNEYFFFSQAELAQQHACEKFEQMSDKGKEGILNNLLYLTSFFSIFIKLLNKNIISRIT